MSKYIPRSIPLRSRACFRLFFAATGSLVLAQSILLTSAEQANAADFAHAKHVYVPATRIRRNSTSELREAMPYAAIDPQTGSSVMGVTPNAAFGAPSQVMPFNGLPLPVPTYGNTTPAPKPGKYGLVPPPPPVTPSIVPPSGVISNTLDSFRALHPQPSPTPRATYAAPSTASRAKAQINQLISEGKLNEAHDTIKHYLKSFPRDQQMRAEITATLIERGKQFANASEFENAVRAAREALAVEPSNGNASALLNDSLKKLGIDSHSAAERLKQGNLLAAQGKSTEALVEFRAAGKLKPSAEAHIGTGNMLMREGKKDSAKQEFQKALELEPNSSEALRQMGTLRYAMNDVVGANADLSRALIINPDDKQASRSLVDLWQRQVSRGPRDVNSHLGLARAYQLSGDLKSAQNEYKQVVRLDPENPNLPAARHSFKLALARQEAKKAHLAAQTLESHGALREAHQKILEACALAPADVPIRMYEGDLARKLGLYSQAHEAYMSVLREDPKNTVAAQRLRELSLQSINRTQEPRPAPGFGANQSQSSPGLASPAVLSFLNKQQLNQMRPGELPPLSNLPAPVQGLGMPPQAQSDHVNSLAGLLSQIRSVSLSEKERLGKIEDAAQAALGLKGSGASSVLNLPPLPPLPPLTSETPVLAAAGATAKATTTAAAASTAAQTATAATAAPEVAPPINSLAGLALKTLPGLNQGGSTTSNLATAAAQMAPSIFGGGGLKGMTQEDLQTLLKSPLAQKFGIQVPEEPQPAAEPEKPAGDKSMESIQSAYQRIGTLEEKNRQLMAQLEQAQVALKQQSVMPASVKTEPAETVPPQNQFSMPQDLMPPSPSPDPMPAPDFRQSNPQPTSALPPSQPAPEAGLRAVQGTLKPGGNLRFELEGVVPSWSDIRLKVVLKNDRDTALELPQNVKAVIKMSGQEDRIVNVSFPSRQIPAHGESHGIIRVPGHNLNASADLYLPDFLPPDEPYRHVHLSVPISKL